jgi:transporter family-2 protein
MNSTLWLAVLLGISVCVQGVANGRLSGRIGLPMALAINAGLVFVATLVWLWLAPTPERTERAAAPWYLYVGGVCGLAILVCAALAYPRLGAATTTSVAVASQVLTALALDHFGAAGQPPQLGLARVAGVVLVAIGVALVLGGAPRNATD